MKGILIDPETGDLQIGRNGIDIGDTSRQTALAVILAMRGEFKEHPLLGGEAGRLRAGRPDPMWAGKVRQMLSGCGVECERVSIDSDGTITIEQ